MALAAIHAAAQPFLPGQNLLATGKQTSGFNNAPVSVRMVVLYMLCQ